MSAWLSPLKSIRRECLYCMSSSRLLVRDCPSTACRLWPYRLGKRPTSGAHRPLRAIRKHCLACAGSSDAVRNCDGKLLGGKICPLHRFRFGKNPARRHSRKPVRPINRCVQEGWQSLFHGAVKRPQDDLSPVHGHSFFPVIARP